MTECTQEIGTTATTNNVAIAQANCGSEFYGSITIIDNGGGNGNLNIQNCDISCDGDVNRVLTNQTSTTRTYQYTYSLNVFNGTQPYIYNWEFFARSVSNGSTINRPLGTSTDENPVESFTIGFDGFFSDTEQVVANVTVTDINGCQTSTEITAKVLFE